MYKENANRMVQHASIAEARAELSALVNKVAHGRERIILTSRGHPKAALVSLEDLETLGDGITVSSRLAALREADDLVEQMRLESRRRPRSDSVDLLRELREDRSDLRRH